MHINMNDCTIQNIAAWRMPYQLEISKTLVRKALIQTSKRTHCYELSHTYLSCSSVFVYLCNTCLLILIIFLPETWSGMVLAGRSVRNEVFNTVIHCSNQRARPLYIKFLQLEVIKWMWTDLKYVNNTVDL
jgi:hypothetical protein